MTHDTQAPGLVAKRLREAADVHEEAGRPFMALESREAADLIEQQAARIAGLEADYRRVYTEACELRHQGLSNYVTSFEVLAGPENDPISCSFLDRDHPWQSKPTYEAVVTLRWQGQAPPAILALARRDAAPKAEGEAQSEIDRLKAVLWSIGHAAGIETKDALMLHARSALTSRDAAPREGG